MFQLWAMESCCCLCPDSLSDSGVGTKARRAFRHAWVWYREYLLGLALALLTVEIAKVMVNEPRPHFIDTCKPDVMDAPGGCKAAASPSGLVY
jgi:phosphatidate phosphatase